MRITADTDRCIGAGQCVLAAGEVFDQDDDGIVTVLTPEPDASTVDAVRQAVQICPSGAIALEES
jgi:ferredoxin